MMGISAATGGPEFFASIPAEELKNIRVVNQLGPELQTEEPVEDVPATWGSPGAGYSAVSFWFAHKLLRHFGGEVRLRAGVGLRQCLARSLPDFRTGLHENRPA